ncbi:hypothetical protein GKR50_01535 [Providencia rustigianii]|uniref:hypothetical protein n=1 Tax=Providencia rustigianii TaxID=158850 RepID=UPI000F71E9E4|nr:hypothetical protein [Providencia rustigianii]MTC58704.1 hypothetical protein [Providencia rustigianii]VEH54518.1 Uncharacterised protein [Providencia rustigianii]
MSSKLFKASQELFNNQNDDIDKSEELTFQYLSVFLETHFWVEIKEVSESNIQLCFHNQDGYEGPVINAAIVMDNADSPPTKLLNEKSEDTTFRSMSGIELISLRHQVAFNVMAYEVDNPERLMPFSNKILTFYTEYLINAIDEDESHHTEQASLNTKANIAIGLTFIFIALGAFTMYYTYF